MIRIRLLGVCGISLTTIALGAAGTADAQSIPQAAAAFLEIEGIPGESLDESHRGWIDISSFELAQTQPGAGGSPSTGAGAGRVNVSSIEITKKVDKSSNALRMALSAGTHFKKVIIELRKAGGDPLNAKYYRVTMSDAVVARDTVKVASGASPMPSESLSLNFGKIVYEYSQQKPDGSPGPYQRVQEGYDVKTNVRM